MLMKKDIGDIIKIVRRRTGDDAGLLAHELIQVCCGLSFEWLGEDKGKKEILRIVEECFNHGKK